MKPTPLTMSDGGSRLSLAEVFERWQKDNPDRPTERMAPFGYRECSREGCMTYISETANRTLCYWHGGKPDNMQRRPRRRKGWLTDVVVERFDAE